MGESIMLVGGLIKMGVIERGGLKNGNESKW
jgi:hypothetical protein